jgi:TatD family-associated radical SAM protein
MSVQQVISYVIGDNLYLSITDRCTLVCAFCPKTHGDHQVKGYDLSIDHRPEVAEIISAIDDPSRYHQVVFCGYGESTLRLNTLLEVARWIKQHGGRVRVNTDGLANLVHKRNVLADMQGVVDSLSVSLNAQNEEVYNRHCQPQLPGSWQAVVAFLSLAPQYIPEVTATAIDGLDGVDIAACARIATDAGCKFRARALDVVG